MVKERSKQTCPSTRHRIRLQLYVPTDIVRTHREVPLVQTLHRYDDGVTETRYEANIATSHPIWCARTPVDLSLKAEHTYFPDGRIDTTTLIVAVKEHPQPEVIDLTNESDGDTAEVHNHIDICIRRTHNIEYQSLLTVLYALYFDFTLTVTLTFTYSCIFTNSTNLHNVRMQYQSI